MHDMYLYAQMSKLDGWVFTNPLQNEEEKTPLL